MFLYRRRCCVQIIGEKLLFTKQSRTSKPEVIQHFPRCFSRLDADWSTSSKNTISNLTQLVENQMSNGSRKIFRGFEKLAHSSFCSESIINLFAKTMCRFSNILTKRFGNEKKIIFITMFL